MASPRRFEALRAQYERDLQYELAAQPARHAPPIELGQLSTLPAPVREFAHASGCLAGSQPNNARIVWRTMQLRSAPDARWLPVECEQVNFFRDPTRLALMRSHLAGVLPFSAYDRYRHARGRMSINLAGALPLRRVYGQHMDVSALVTYLSEAILLPVVLIDPRLRWTPLDASSARATLQHVGSCVSGVFSFGPAHEWVRFETEDRWRDGRVPSRQRWSAEARAFRLHAGLRVPGDASAHWHTEQGLFTYMRGEVESIHYDITDARALPLPHLRSLARASWRAACCSSMQAHEGASGGHV